MVVNSIAAPADPKRDEAARALLPTVSYWPLYILRQSWGAFPAGTVLRRAPSSKDERVRYLVNNVVCECYDYAVAMNVCKHVRAVLLYEAELAAGRERDARIAVTHPLPKSAQQLYEEAETRRTRLGLPTPLVRYEMLEI